MSCLAFCVVWMVSMFVVGEEAKSNNSTRADHSLAIVPGVPVQELLEQARRAVPSIEIPELKALALVSLGVCEAKAGDPARARQTFSEARNASVGIRSPYFGGRDYFLQRVYEAQLEAQDWEGCEQTLQEIRSPSHRVDCLTRLAILQSKTADDATQRRIFVRIKQELADGNEAGGFHSAAELARAHAKAGHAEFSKQMFAEIKGMARRKVISSRLVRRMNPSQV